MENFIVKTRRPETDTNNPHFFVLSKGMNAGKPLTSPCANCFIIEAENTKSREILYWISYALWRSNGFHPLLVGSVIPFLRIGQYRSLLLQKRQSLNGNFPEAIKKLRLIEENEKVLAEKLRLIRDLKAAFLRQSLNVKARV